MKLEAGKFYRTRDGRKAYVAGESPFEASLERYRFAGWVEGTKGVAAWASDGSLTMSALSGFDLVEEWPERQEYWAVLGPANFFTGFFTRSRAKVHAETYGGKVIKLREVTE
jgi:hypothetical protein